MGTGPRGNYVHAGRHGVYYRTTLGGGRPRPASRQPTLPAPPITAPDVVLEDVTGASALSLVPTGPGELVEQLNEAAKRWPLWPLVIVGLVVALVAQPLVGLILLAPGIPALVWLALRDRARRTTVAFYDVNDEVAVWFNHLVASFQELSRANRIWRINTAGKVQTTHQYKVSGGASTLISRANAAIGSAGPRALVTNIAVPSIIVGRQALYFLPDRLLVRDRRRFSDVAYGALETSGGDERFIEDQSVPRDAQKIDETWRFVNVKGGPDRRFKNNRVIPVMRYGSMIFSSGGGLLWLLLVSRPEFASRAVEAVRRAPSAVDKRIDKLPERDAILG